MVLVSLTKLLNVTHFYAVFSQHLKIKGRSRRGVTNPFASRRSPSPESAKKREASPKSSPEFKKMFGRLKNIIDSEGDSD